MKINEKQWKSMKNNRKSLIFKDFGGFHEIHWAEHAHGRSCQTDALSFPRRKRTFQKCFGTFELRFQVFSGLGLGSVRSRSYMSPKAMKINEKQWKSIENHWFSRILEDSMKFIEPNTTVDHARLMHWVFPSETNVSEVFRNVWITFSGFLRFGAWFSTFEVLP